MYTECVYYTWNTQLRKDRHPAERLFDNDGGQEQKCTKNREHSIQNGENQQKSIYNRSGFVMFGSPDAWVCSCFCFFFFLSFFFFFRSFSSSCLRCFLCFFSCALSARSPLFDSIWLSKLDTSLVLCLLFFCLCFFLRDGCAIKRYCSGICNWTNRERGWLGLVNNQIYTAHFTANKSPDTHWTRMQPKTSQLILA